MDDASIREYLARVADEFRARANVLEPLVSHRLVLGEYRETILREFLRERLFPRYLIASGFFLCPDRSSRQHDIMVLDPTARPMTFYRGEVAVVEASMVRIAIEVKTGFDGRDISDMLEKGDDARSRNPLIAAVGFSFGLGRPPSNNTFVDRFGDAMKQFTGYLPNVMVFGDAYAAIRTSDKKMELFGLGNRAGIEIINAGLLAWLYDDRRHLPRAALHGLKWLESWSNPDWK